MTSQTPISQQLVLITGAGSGIGDAIAISWLRINRAALPAVQRKGHGLLMYVGSTTSRLHEPFIGQYVASKAASARDRPPVHPSHRQAGGHLAHKARSP